MVMGVLGSRIIASRELPLMRCMTSTSHGRLSEEQRQAAGITQNMVRVAAGLDDVEDLKADLLRGLDSL